MPGNLTPGHPVTEQQKSTHITRIEHKITTAERERRNKHKGGVLWFTGLSGAGKSTLAFRLEEELFKLGYQVYVLDGDNVRYGLNSDLGFSHQDRTENVRRVAEVAALFADAGVICITAFISPYRQDRASARRAAGDKFHEVYLAASVEACEKRDPKGLYKRARAGEIQDFTGLSAPYEAPTAAEISIDTGREGIATSMTTLLHYVASEFGGDASPQVRSS